MSKYEKMFHSTDGQAFQADVYSVLEAFGVACPAVQHAIKKLLMPGQRGAKSELQDLDEAHLSVCRAIDMARARLGEGGTVAGEAEPEPETEAETEAKPKREHKRDGEKRIYVWHEFAPDFSNGLAVALAASELEARRLVVERLRFTPADWGPLTTLTVNAGAEAWAVTGGQ